MKQLNRLLFLDIETVPVVADYKELSGKMRAHWDKKSVYMKIRIDEDADPARLFRDRAAIWSEFGKIVCIGLGRVAESENRHSLLLKSLTEDDEKELLKGFVAEWIHFEKRFGVPVLCGHNIREFDLPFLCRRLLIHNLPVPSGLQLQGKKP